MSPLAPEKQSKYNVRIKTLSTSYPYQTEICLELITCSSFRHGWRVPSIPPNAPSAPIRQTIDRARKHAGAESIVDIDDGDA